MIFFRVHAVRVLLSSTHSFRSLGRTGILVGKSTNLQDESLIGQLDLSSVPQHRPRESRLTRSAGVCHLIGDCALHREGPGLLENWRRAIDTLSPGHEKPESLHRREICLAGRWLCDRGFTPATDGNLSVRLDGARILATPSGISKGHLAPEDLVVTALDGRLLEGDRSPSTELGMHLLIYQKRPEVNAVCHAHPCVATGFAAAGINLDRPLLAESVATLGSVPIAPYATPGTPELAEALEPFVASYDAILMANHGVVTCGVNLLSAFHRMEIVEHYARVTLVTQLLGRENLLSDEEVVILRRAKARIASAVTMSRSPER